MTSKKRDNVRSAKILVFTGYFYPHVGGHEQNTRELTKRLIPYGYHIDLITCNTENALSYEEVDGIHVHRLPSWNILGGTYPIPQPTLKSLKIIYGVLGTNYDLIQTNTRFFITSLIGLFVSKLTNKPLLHIEYGSRHSELSNFLADALSKLYDHTIGALIVKNSDMLICNCNASEKFLRHLGAKNKVRCIPIYGINNNIFKKKYTNLRNELRISDALVITSISRLIEAKGVQDIISAFLQIKRKIPDSKLVIIGNGPYRLELARLAKEIDGESILFLGQLPPSKVAEVLNITDIFINASYSEALIASPVIEAGAIGVPSVTTDVGGTREVIVDYVNGLLFSPGDTDTLARKTCEVLANKCLKDKLSKNIEYIVQSQFNWNKNIEIYAREIESLINGGTR